MNRHFRPMQVFIDTPSSTVLLLTPKVMTTFLRVLITDGLREFRGMDDPSEGRYPFTPWAKRFPLYPVRSYLHLFRRPSSYKIHAVVRHPHARILSAWKDKFRDPHRFEATKGIEAYPPSIRKSELVSVRRFARQSGLNGGVDGTLVPFSTFVSYVEKTPAGRRNHHWDLQVLSLQMPALPLHVPIRMETDLYEGLPDALARVGFDKDWVRDRLKKPRGASGVSSGTEWTPDLWQRVAAIYALDFEALRYDPEKLPG